MVLTTPVVRFGLMKSSVTTIRSRLSRTNWMVVAKPPFATIRKKEAPPLKSLLWQGRAVHEPTVRDFPCARWSKSESRKVTTNCWLVYFPYVAALKIGDEMYNFLAIRKVIFRKERYFNFIRAEWGRPKADYANMVSNYIDISSSG